MSAGAYSRAVAAGPERVLIDRERDRPDLDMERAPAAVPLRASPRIVSADRKVRAPTA